MALFHNSSFLNGFFCGLNSWFYPTLPFCNPFAAPYIGSNPFCMPNPFCMTNPFFSGYSGWNSMPSFYPIFDDNTPSVDWSGVNLGNSIWSNDACRSFWDRSPSQNYSFNNSFDWSFGGWSPAFGNKDVSESQETSKSKKKTNKTGSTPTSKSGKLHSEKVTGNVNHSYTTLSKSAAEAKAKQDSNLEDLRESSKRSNGWELKSSSFGHDITFAKKGTGKILEEVYRKTGIKLYITSALGTGEGKSPHQIGNGYASHHNAENPKLDISLDCQVNGSSRKMDAHEMAEKLWATGLFCWILEEPNRNHLDVQIHPDAFKKLGITA